MSFVKYADKDFDYVTFVSQMERHCELFAHRSADDDLLQMLEHIAFLSHNIDAYL